jgi:hypothetical protein
MSRHPTPDGINEPVGEVPMNDSILESVLRTARAVIEYDVESADGIAANLCIALCEISATDALAESVRDGGALAYGLVWVTGVPDGPEHPVLWELFETNGVSGVSVTAADGDSDLSAEAYDLCVRTLLRFFMDVADAAPVLSAKAQEMTDAYDLGQFIDSAKLH